VSSVLLTGATGFLGRHILWDLLRQSNDTTVACVLRATRGSPERRLHRTLAAAGDWLPLDARDRCTAVEGDLTDERLVTDAAVRDRLVGTVDRVVHCAATVQFDTPLAKARSVNVDGTRNVLRFATDAHTTGRLGRIDHFSTAYVAGRAQGLVREDELFPTTFTNTYEQTKWESEQLVREHQGDLPITIFRPSIVVGDSKTGYTSNFRVLYWPLKTLASGLAIVAPLDPNGIVDLVPVDYVVDAFRQLSSTEASLGRCYHLAAGPDGERTCGELLDAAVELFGVRRPLLISPRISYSIVRPMLYATIWGKRRPLLRQAEQYFPYFAYRASFDTSIATADLAGSGVTPPAVADYFETIVRYCIDTDWGATAARTPGRGS
jgi:thioester reductase-like protein